MAIFFFFILVFSPAGHLQSVTSSKAYSNYAECNQEHDKLFHRVPVSEGSRRVVTPCSSFNLQAIPRCQ